MIAKFVDNLESLIYSIPSPFDILLKADPNSNKEK
jgi:hypothetical protein